MPEIKLIVGVACGMAIYNLLAHLVKKIAYRREENAYKEAVVRAREGAIYGRTGRMSSTANHLSNRPKHE